MPSNIPYLRETFMQRYGRTGLIVVSALIVLIALYVAYSKIEKMFADDRIYMEGVIDTKILALDANVRKRLDNIQVINEQKTIIYKQTTTIYQSSQKDLESIDALKTKPMADIIDAWNKTL